MLGVVFADVRQVEPLRRRIVQLDRAELPRAAERIGHVEVDLWTVERAVTRLQGIRATGRLERRPQCPLGVVPHRIVSDSRLWARRKLQGRSEAERLVVAKDELHQES